MRSGTTLLQNLLHGGGENWRHPELAFAPDTVTDLRDLTLRVASMTSQPAPLMNANVSADFLQEWQRQAAQLIAPLREKVMSIAPAPEPVAFGVKLTSLLPELYALERLEGLETRFIIMRRDPRDIFASAIKRYGEDERAPFHAFMNAALTLDYAGCRIPNSMFVRYEELVTHPHETLHSVLNFIGLTPSRYDWSCLDGGLINNSSFAELGPDETVQNSSIMPSIGRYRDIDKFYQDAISELLGDAIAAQTRRPSRRCRRQIYGSFIPQVMALANQIGYAIHGLRNAVEKRRGILLQASLLTESLWRKLNHSCRSPIGR